MATCWWREGLEGPEGGLGEGIEVGVTGAIGYLERGKVGGD